MIYSGLKDATHIIAGSEYTKKQIIKYYKISPDKISVMYAGVDEVLYCMNKDKQDMGAIRDKYKLSLEADYIFHISNEQKHN